MSIARAFRIIKWFLKFVVGLVSVAIVVFFVWRAFFSGILPESMKALSPNEPLASAYVEGGGELDAFSQEQRSLTSTDRNSGYFSVERATIIPGANQIQIVFRYNNSTLRHTMEDFSLPSEPTREDEVYDVTLLIKTESEVEGEFTETRISPAYFVSDVTSLYNYRLFVYDFGDIDLSELLDEGALESIFLDVYYKGAVDYEAEAYGTLCIYDYITETYDVKLSRADRKAIEGYSSK